MAKPKKAKVEVELKKSASPPGFTWKIESDYKKGDKLEFNNNKHPGFDVQFDLDNDGTGYLFPDDPDLAIAAKPFTGDPKPPPCPDQGETWDQFIPVSVEEDNTRLCVYNLNKTKTKFAYTLFLTKEPHAENPKCEPLDPIGSNQNGPRYSSSVGFLAMVAGIGVVSLLLAYTFNIFERR
jgi:hypothetical protein